MTCPICWAPIMPGATFCDFCRVAIRNEGGRIITIHPPIQPGPALLALDLRSDAPPGYAKRQYQWDGGSKMEPGGEGVVVAVSGAQTLPFVQEFLRMRDAICRASMIAYDSEMILGVLGRREPLGKAETQYVFDVWPERRAIRLARYVATPAFYMTDLVPWTESTAVAPVGYPNLVELRLQGPTLQGWVNGAHVATAHDPVYGIGRTGMRVGNQTGGVRRALCQRFEVYAVIA